MRDSAILATGLRKSYGDHLVLDGVDLNVAAGTVFALLGPNGARKTTMDNLLTGEENLILMADLHRLGRERELRPTGV